MRVQGVLAGAEGQASALLVRAGCSRRALVAARPAARKERRVCGRFDVTLDSYFGTPTLIPALLCLGTERNGGGVATAAMAAVADGGGDDVAGIVPADLAAVQQAEEGPQDGVPEGVPEVPEENM